MKLWAVVIGRKGRHKRYIHQKCVEGLSVYLSRDEARKERQNLMREWSSKHIYVIPFNPI